MKCVMEPYLQSQACGTHDGVPMVEDDVITKAYHHLEHPREKYRESQAEAKQFGNKD